MKNLKFLIFTLIIIGFLSVAGTSMAEHKKSSSNVTTIHLDQYGGYFDAKETLSGLKSGKYEFVITNKTNKVVGFQIQNFKTHEQLDMFPLEPNETKTSMVNISADGFRFRCPINPTPWYDMDGVTDR